MVNKVNDWHLGEKKGKKEGENVEWDDVEMIHTIGDMYYHNSYYCMT